MKHHAQEILMAACIYMNGEGVYFIIKFNPWGGFSLMCLDEGEGPLWIILTHPMEFPNLALDLGVPTYFIWVNPSPI